MNVFIIHLLFFFPRWLSLSPSLSPEKPTSIRMNLWKGNFCESHWKFRGKFNNGKERASGYSWVFPSFMFTPNPPLSIRTLYITMCLHFHVNHSWNFSFTSPASARSSLFFWFLFLSKPSLEAYLKC